MTDNPIVDEFDKKLNAAVVTLKRELSEVVKVNDQLISENFLLDKKVKKLEKDFVMHSHSMRNGSVVIPVRSVD